MPNTPGSASGGRGALRLIARIVFPLVLVYATWNPTGRSFYHQGIAPILEGTGSIGPGTVLAALLLVAGWVVALTATKDSLGIGGMVLVAGILAALAWFLYDRRVLQAGDATALAHVVLVALGLLLAVGMSWGILRKGMTGQVDVNQ